MYFQIPNRRSSSETTMANKIRDRAESDVRSSNQSETTEPRIELEDDERITESEIFIPEKTSETSEQEIIANDEPADLPNFSNTPLKRYSIAVLVIPGMFIHSVVKMCQLIFIFSVQNLGDGHSISSTKSRRGKRALHEKLRQMRKAKSEKQNPNK